MKVISVAIFIIALSIFHGETCKILLNEINSHDICGSAKEFIELTAHKCKEKDKSLHTFLVLILSEYNKKAKGPAIVFSADLVGQNFEISHSNEQHNHFFVIGKNNDLKFDSVQVGFIPPPKDFFKPADSTSNVIDDGDIYPNALLLLRIPRNSANGPKLQSLKLSYRDTVSRREVKKDSPILLTEELQSLVKEHLVDMIVYSKRSDFVSSPVFFNLMPEAIRSDLTDYDIRPGTEFDSKTKDRSISRCPRREHAIGSFQFNTFKLSSPTPGKANECRNAIRYLLGDRDIPETIDISTPNDNNDEIEGAPATKKRKLADTDIEKDVEVVYDATPPEKTRIEETTEAFYETLAKRTMQMLEDIKNQITGSLGITYSEPDEHQKFPWNDDTLWSKADDLMIKQAFGDKLKITQHQKTWLKVIPTDDPKNPNFGCRICGGHLQRNPHLSHKILGNLAKPEGASYPENSVQSKSEYWRKYFDAHERPRGNGKPLKNHAKIIIEMRRQTLEPQSNQLQKALGNLDQSKLATSRVVMTAYTTIKKHIPFRVYPTLINNLKRCGAIPVNALHGNRRSLARIINTISRSMRSSFIHTLKTAKPPLTIILDGSSDKQSRQYLLVYLQFTFELKAYVKLYKVIKIDSEVAEDMKNVLLQNFESDGILQVVKETLVGFTSDGAANMAGIHGGLGALIQKWIRENPVSLQRRPPIFRSHCLAHRLQLSLQSVMAALPSTSNLHFRFESMINGLYAFYKAHACKRTASLDNFAELYAYKLLKLKSIIKIRWINSQFPAIHTFERNYYLLLFHLKHLQSAPEFKNDITTTSTAKGYYTELNTLDFKIYLLMMHDILHPISQLSEKLQKNLYSISKVQADLESTISKLTEIQESYGPKVDHFLFLAKCEKGGETVPCTIELFEEEDESIKVSMPMRHYFDGVEPEENVNFERRRMRVRFSAIKDTLIPAIIAELRSKFPEDPQLMKALAALHPDEVPFSTRATENYCKRLKPIVERFGGPDYQILNECKAVLDEAYLNDQTNYLKKLHTTMEEFWHYAISYANKVRKVEVGELKPFISKIMAIAPTSVIAERGFSSFFYTKSSRRSELSETSLQDIMEILINGPSAETFDPFPAVNKWLAEGHYQSDHHLPQIDSNTELLPEPEDPTEVFIDEHTEIQNVDLGEAEEEEEAGIADDLAIFIDDVSEEDPIFPENSV